MAKKESKEKTAFDKLSDRHKSFVSHYLGDCLYNATQSYLKTYPKAQYNSAVAKGSELLRNVKVKEAIKEISEKQFADIQSEIAKNETYQKIKALSDMSIEDVVDLAGQTLVVKSLDEIPPKARYAIKSIKYDRKETETTMSENIHVTFEPKLQALKILGEIQGLIDKEDNNQKIEVVVKPAEFPDE
jgi:phage terminase small subunit